MNQGAKRSALNERGDDLTADRLRELLDYDPLTGIFRWRVKRANKEIGDVAGYYNKIGYLEVGLDYRLYYGHRLAWLYVYGEWPPKHTDHIEGKSNRIDNLRPASCSQNIANSKLHKNNTTGFKGVFRHRGRYIARITVARQNHHLGIFNTPEEASAAYLSAAQEAFGEFARTA